MENVVILTTKGIKVSINDTELELKPMVLQKYIDIWSDLMGLVEQVLKTHPNLDLDKFEIGDLMILAPVIPSIAGLLNDIIGTDKGFVESNVDIDGLFQLILVVIEVNKLERMAKNFKLAKNAWSKLQDK